MKSAKYICDLHSNGDFWKFLRFTKSLIFHQNFAVLNKNLQYLRNIESLKPFIFPEFPTIKVGKNLEIKFLSE